MSNSYADHFSKLKKTKSQADSVNLKSNFKKTSVQNKKALPIKAILGSVVGVAGCLFALLIDDIQLPQLPKIEFGFFEQSVAQEVPSKEVKQEVKPEIQEQKPTVLAEPHLLNLTKRSHELDLREQEIAKLEKEFEKKNKEISDKIAQLEKIRADISEKLKDQVQKDNKKIDQLVEVYSAMRPGQAAKIFEDLEEELAVSVLTKMKKKNAAEILNLMKVEKAKKFTELYTGFRGLASEKP